MFHTDRVRICTLQIGIPLAKSFVDHPRSRVVAVYGSTTQLVGAEGQLWAVTTRENEGAYRIVTNSLPRWMVDSIVEFSDNALHAQGDQIAWDESALWNPHVTRRELTNAEKSAAANQIAAFLSEREFATHDARGFWNSLADAWENCHCEQSEAISRSRSGTAMSHQTLFAMTSKLIGRGPGLTPTGDDFIQAFLVTLASGDANDRHLFQRACESLRPLLSKTTPLSRAFLQEAMQGFSFGGLKDLLEALPTVSTTHLTRLVDIGATSGFAYALGVLFALNYRLPITNN